MYIVRYRTHGPWQSEPIPFDDDKDDAHNDAWRCRAVQVATELSKSFGEVSLDYHECVYHWKGGSLIGP